jgi:hypothetical protein
MTVEPLVNAGATMSSFKYLGNNDRIDIVANRRSPKADNHAVLDCAVPVANLDQLASTFSI